MVAVSNKNCAHIMSTPPAISWSSLMINDVKAKTTAEKKLPIATKASVFLSCTISNKKAEERLTPPRCYLRYHKLFNVTTVQYVAFANRIGSNSVLESRC